MSRSKAETSPVRLLLRDWFGVFETFAAKGDDCARECREKMQIMVAGGDGTCARVRPSLLPAVSRNLYP
uniref:DAGKc domain-containing protein n=1 Tax=Brassica oleracea var. oleracea TaxID=109376 RepID=A0A0D3EI23_BRAOL